MIEFLKSIGITIPDGAVSYNTDGLNKIIFLIGKTGKFLEISLTNNQINSMKHYKCFGGFGWDL